MTDDEPPIDLTDPRLGYSHTRPLQTDRPTATNGNHPPPPDASPLMRLWTAAQLSELPRTFQWQVKGMLTLPTYGQVAGGFKTLKSYVGSCVDVAIAAGIPLFDHFAVPAAAPVIVYVGEGGMIPYTNRLERIARSMGLKFSDLPIHVSFDIARIGSPRFEASMADHLRAVQPGLLHIDPLYAFHSATDARNLFESGAMLSSISSPCMEAGVNLLINNHWNKTGEGKGLSRITQAGSAEWCDTWALLSHRQTPDVEQGKFWLLLEIGSRQWGGAEWDLDLDIGPFDIEAGEHRGDITWQLSRHTPGNDPKTDDAIRRRITEALEEDPWTLTRTQLYAITKGNRDKYDATLDKMLMDGSIVFQPITRTEGTRTVTRKMLGPNTNPDPLVGTGWSDSDEF